MLTITRGLLCGVLILLSGCASYSSALKKTPVSNQKDIVYLEAVPPVAQKAYQCGPASLESVMRYWGKPADAESIGKTLLTPGARAVFNFSLAKYAKEQGFWSETPDATEETLKEYLRLGLPPIVMIHVGVLWVEAYHFIVLKGFNEREGVFYANTGEAQTQTIPYDAFRKKWQKALRWCLLICPPQKVSWDLDVTKTNELALLFEKEEKLEEAEKGYRKAFDKDPDNDVSRFNLANIYLKKKQFAEAETIYTELLAKKPDWGQVSNNLAWIFFVRENYTEAVRIIETSLKNGAPRQFDNLDTLGLAYCRMGEKERAWQILSEARDKVSKENLRALESIEDHIRECGP